MGKIPYNYQNKRKNYHLDKKILCIDILKNDVYIEYTNREFEYISFTKAKKIVFEISTPSFSYSCMDSKRSVNFLNSLLTRYMTDNDTLVIKH